MSNKKERIDVLLVSRGLVSTRARAQAMILAGHVLVNDTPVTKAGDRVAEDADIRLREPEMQYVSRGALKFKKAIEGFGLRVEGKNAIDVGSSTGGFTEVLLEQGALKVYAVDVGSNQLAWKIRNDARVVSMENYNARNLQREDFPDRLRIAVMDVSFISVRLIIPSLLKILEPGSDLVVLFKPQFEVGREHICDGGIVRNQEAAKKTLDDLIEWSKSFGLAHQGTITSPIQGTDGNTEYLSYWITPKSNI
ncbi:MAG: TlyA family RNA methyltransferase [Bdellovibrionales bacterium]|nr:TlyA family RNA methyltransferase [Bdellovibrionales bacterium]